MLLIKSRVWILTGFMMLLPFSAAAAQYDAGVQAKIILQTETMSNGEPIDYLDTDHPSVTVMIVDIAPGAQTGWHSHPVAVYAYVMAGNLSVQLEGGKTFEFKEGEAIIEVVKLKHNGINNGKVPVKLVVFYLGEKDIPNVMKTDKP
jgi:quercetin dioxygenase-like cupin family protein